MTWQRLSHWVAAGLVAGTMFWAGAVAARADNPNTTTLTAACDNGQTVTVELEGATPGNAAFPSALRVVSDTSVFTIHEFVITNLATGETFTIKNDSGVANNTDLVACSRTGVAFSFTWIGFFTPAS
jgi:hypothetical protein